MAVRNNNCCRPNPPQEPAVPPLPVAETAAEADTQPEETLSAALCRIDCELARQTRLLEDIRTLLERRADR